MAISSIGVGSGLPLDQLLEDIRKSENQPLAQLAQRQTITKARLSGYGTIKGALTDLQNAAQALTKPEKYGALKATSSNEGIGVSVGNSAVAGNYNLENIQLATHQSITFAAQSSRDQNIGDGAGTLTVTLANGEAHEIELGSDTSLQGIMKSINANPDLGIQATLVNDGSDTPYHLMFTATNTGTEASVATISVEGNEALNDAIGFNANNSSDAYTVNAAKNASLTINGIDITSQSNTIEDVIEGVTLNLNKVPNNGETVNLAITRDDSVTINAVKDFVKAYNSLLDTIQTQTSFNAETEQSSALTGDSLVRRAETQVRSALNSVIGEDSIRTLGDLGITTDYKTGKLEVDDDKLSSAVKDNLAAVTQFLSSDTGLGKTIDNITAEFTKSNGYIQNATDSINQSLRDLQKQYDATQDRIDTKMENYRRQFSQLDVLVNQMNGISNYLTQQLSMLGNMNSSSNK